MEIERLKVIFLISIISIIWTSILLWKEYRRQRNFRCHFGEDDILIDDIVLNPVHILPENQWGVNQEIDFYMKDSRNVYLLRIINNDEYTMTLCDSTEIRYIIICIPMNDTYPTLEKIIYKLKEFPYAKKIKHKEQTYRFVL